MSAPVLERPTEESVLFALDALGNSPVKVAASLIEKGITGNRHSAGSCPIAEYLKAQFPGVSVSTYYSSAIYEIGDNGLLDDRKEIVNVENPDPVVRFIREFDNGGYPTLAAL